MKSVVAVVAMLALCPPNCFAFFKRQPSPAAMLARVTVYWAGGGPGSDRYTRKHQCATGLRLQTGHCAVDPAKIAYGSTIVFPDGTTLSAVDTGTAVRTRKAARLSGRSPFEREAVVIDRFFETRQEALNWAKLHPLFMAVRVIPPHQAVALLPKASHIRVRRAVALNRSKNALPSPAEGPRFAALQLPKLVR